MRNVKVVMEVDKKDGGDFPPQYKVVDVVVVEEK
jgi:hypothetical protein